MSDPEDKKPAPETGADDKTRYAGGPARPAKGADDAAGGPAPTSAPEPRSGRDGTAAPETDDRTRFVARPMAPDAGDADAASVPAKGSRAAEDDEATQFAPGAGDDDGATQFAPPPEPPDGDGDATQYAAPPGGERTEFAPSAGGPSPLAQPRSGLAGGAGATVTVGTLINNNYEIREVLKSGGMGEVYRGVEIGTGDPVAIKAILPELAEDEKAGLLFKREARTLRQLADESIVRYYNYVHDRDLDRYFLIMEFIGGVPLSEHTDTHGPIAPQAAQTLMKRLAKGLARAHAQDVVHRDLSPDNVMLPEGIVGEAVLIDFGIAKSNVVTEGTMHGQFAGKFKYVAPEQLGHYGGIIGPYTDIYGLALLISAAVIGKPLDMGSSIVEAVESRRQIPDLSAVPAELRPILAHMLEPDPANRPASMEAVRQMLEAPGTVPRKYWSDGALPVTGTGPLQAPPGMAGLQAPPTTGVGTLPPQTHAPTTLPPGLEDPPDRSGSGILLGLGAVFVAILGAAGWYAWSEGLIGPAPPDLPGSTGREEAPSAGIPEPLSATREGFLAAFDTGPCTYASRIGSGRNAGMVEGFARQEGGFAGLPVAYEEQFGARPAILDRRVTAAQCPALEFARALQGRGAQGVQMALAEDSVTSGATISGQVAAPPGQSLWAVVITPTGAVFNLTPRLSEPVGGRRSLRFGLNLTPGAEAAPQLVLVVASDTPLARAAAAREGMAAATLLPQVLEEIALKGGRATVDLGHVLLTPPED